MQLDSPSRARLMPDLLRYSVYVGFGVVWVTGCAWLVLHLFFETPDEFGIARHPLEPTVLWIHGVSSIAVAYLFGWLMARHASEAWRQQKRRVSGGLLTAVLLVLSASGFALFFLTDSTWQEQSTRVHEILGVAVTMFAVEHWRVMNGRTDASKAPSKNR
jgi:hypothetical protein